MTFQRTFFYKLRPQTVSMSVSGSRVGPRGARGGRGSARARRVPHPHQRPELCRRPHRRRRRDIQVELGSIESRGTLGLLTTEASPLRLQNIRKNRGLMQCY